MYSPAREQLPPMKILYQSEECREKPKVLNLLHAILAKETAVFYFRDTHVTNAVLIRFKIEIFTMCSVLKSNLTYHTAHNRLEMKV